MCAGGRDHFSGNGKHLALNSVFSLYKEMDLLQQNYKEKNVEGDGRTLLK